MLKSFPSLTALALGVALTLPSFAQNTDTVFVSSKLGQPLKATVLLPQDASSVKLAPAEAYQAKGLPLPRLDGLSFDFSKTESGRPFLRISSPSDYESPAQTLLLERLVNGKSEILEYAILVDPLDVSYQSLPKPTASMATPTPVHEAQIVKKTKPVMSKKAFNAATKTVNQRLSALEKGQAELFKRFEVTDKKLNTVLDKLQLQVEKEKPTLVTPSPAKESPTVKKAAIQPAPAVEVAVVKPSEAPVEAKPLKKTDDVSVSVSVNGNEAPVANKTVTPSEPLPAAPPSASTEKQNTAPVPAASKPKKVIQINEPPPAEPTLIETVMNEPLYMGGGLAAVLALILAPFGIRRLRNKKSSSMTSYTMAP
jgi:hypothetical protein